MVAGGHGDVDEVEAAGFGGEEGLVVGIHADAGPLLPRQFAPGFRDVGDRDDVDVARAVAFLALLIASRVAALHDEAVSDERAAKLVHVFVTSMLSTE